MYTPGERGRSDVILSLAACGWPASLASAKRSSSPRTPSPLARSISRWSRSVVASASSRAAMARLVIESESRSERAEPTIGDLVAHEAAGEGDRVDARVGERHPTGALERVAEEGEVEADVVTDDHRVADEFVERGQDRSDPWSLVHERVGQPGQHRDLRRDRPTWVDERLERAEELAAADLDGADLGDLVVGAVARRWSRGRSRRRSHRATGCRVHRTNVAACRVFGSQLPFRDLSTNTCTLSSRAADNLRSPQSAPWPRRVVR